MLIHIHRVKCSSFSNLEFVEAEIQSSVINRIDEIRNCATEAIVIRKFLSFYNFYSRFTLISIIMSNELSTYNPGLSIRACQIGTRGRVRFVWISN